MAVSWIETGLIATTAGLIVLLVIAGLAAWWDLMNDL